MPDFKLTDDSPQRVGFFDELNSPNTPAYTLPRVAGTSGQVITIDANGDCNFQSTGSIGSSGAIEFRALPYFDNVNAAASDWSPSGKTISPEVYFNLSQVSYNGVKTNNTWRYEDPTNLTFTGGNRDTGVTLPALGFATHTDGVKNPNVTGNFIYTDAVGTEHTFSFRIDWLLIQEGAAGEDGSAGTSSRSVTLTASDQSIEYNKDGTTPDPATVTVFAEAINASDTHDVFFEFFVDDVSQGITQAGDNSPHSAQITLTSDSTIGSPKKVEVQIREELDSPISENPILARDQIVIFPLKQGSDGITIILDNDSHTLPTTSSGTVTFAGSGTDIEVYEGTTQLSYDDSAPFANSSFRVTATPTNVTLATGVDAPSTVGNIRRFKPHTAMSADNASVEFSITVKTDEGVERTFTKKQSLSKSNQGEEGSAGSAGRTVTLSAGDQIFEYATNGADPQGKNSGNSGTTITATALNTTDTLIYKFTVDDSPVQSGSSNTYDYTAQTDIANMPDKIEVELREGGDSPPNVVARDQFTIFGVQQGTDAVTIAMDNEAHTVSTNSAGDSPDIYVGSGTNIDVFEGATHLSYDNSPTYDNSSYRISATPSGITIGSASTSSGLDTPPDGGTSGKTRIFGDHSSMTGADAKIVYSITVKRADSTEQTFTRTQSISKSADGEAGADAKTVRLTATDYVIEYDQSGKNPNVSGDSPSEEIVLTATAQNFTDPYFKFTGDITDEGSYTNGTSGDDADTFTFSVPADYSSTPKVIRVDVVEAADTTTEPIAFDSITIASVKEGSGAIFVQLTNDSHVFPADLDGAVTDFDGSGTNIEVYEGATQLDYDGSGTTDGHFTVTTDGGTNITPGGITDSGNVAVVADASTGVADNVNTSKIVFTISGKRGNGDAFSVTKNQTFSKGTTGATGATGSRTVKGILYYKYATEAGTCDSGDTTTMTHAIRAADWSDDEYNTGFEIVNLTQSSGTLNADITDVNGTTGVITHATMVDWNDGVDQYVIRPLPDQDSNAEYDFTETGDSALSGVASNWSVEPPEVQLSKSYQRYWEVEFSATETGVTGDGSISFGTPVPSIRFGVNIQSDNFQAGLEGWQIKRDSGDAEFNNIIARGSLKGGKDGPRDYISYQSPNDDSPAPFDADGIDSPPNRVHTGFYIGPDDRSPTSYDFIIGDATHQLRFDGSKGRLDLKGVANLGVEGTFEAKGNSSIPNTVFYDFANEATIDSPSGETNATLRLYNGTISDDNYSMVSQIITRNGRSGDNYFEIKDDRVALDDPPSDSPTAAFSDKLNSGAIFTFDEFYFRRSDGSSHYPTLKLESDADAHFYGNVQVDGDINFTGSLTQNGSTYGGSGGTSANATNAAHVLVTDNESTNEENLITFVEDATSATGNVGLEMDGNFSYNPSTGTVSATIFKGNIDAVDIDVDGTLETDALSINGTSVTSTAAEINLLDGSTANTVVNSKAVIYGSSGQLAATSATIDRGSFTGDTIPLSVTAAATGSVVVEHRNSSGGAGAGADTNVTHRYAAGPEGGGTDDAEVNLITTHDHDGQSGTFEVKAISDVDAGIVFTFDQVKFRDVSLTTTLDIEADGDAHFHQKVGIGTTPSYTLDVAGNINFTGNLTQNGSTYGGGSGSGTVTGTGNANKISKWSGTSALTDSLITDDGSTVTVGGNLTVNGTTTTVNTTNTTITDNLLELNSGASSNANDSGIIIERGSTGNNALFIWDESADKFALGTTTGTASSTGNITYTDAGLIVGTLDISGDIDVDGTANLDVVDIDGAVDMASTLTIDNDLIFTNRVTTDGHIQLYNGTLSTGYAIGVEADTLYYRGSVKHRWYIQTLADGGTSDYMELTTTALTVNAGLNVSGDANFDSGTLFVDVSENRVGIGTVSPGYKLQVSEASTNFAALISNSTSSGNGLKINAGDNVGDRILELNDKDGNAKFVVKSTAAVGIGTASPAALLHMSSSVPKIQIQDSDGTDQYGQFYHSAGTTAIQARNNTSDGTIVFQKYDGTTTDETMRIDTSGRVGINDTTPDHMLVIKDDATTGKGMHILGGDGGGTLARFERIGDTSGMYVDINCNSGDPQINFTESSGVDWTIGVEGNVFEIVDGSNLTGTSKFEIDSAGDATIKGDLKLDATNANLKLKSGSGNGTNGAVYWTFNTDSTIYGRIDLDYEDRALQGLRMKSIGGYAITLDSGNGINFQEDGTIKGGFSNVGDFYVDTDTLFVDASADRVGINDSTPSYSLDVNGTFRSTGTIYADGAYIRRSSDTSILQLHGGNGTGANIHLYGGSHASLPNAAYYDALVHTFRSQSGGTGNLQCTGDITAFVSDERLKTRVDTIDNAVEKVCSLNGFIYKFNDTAKDLGFDTEKREVGLSAQEVEKVLPEVIKPAPVDNKYKTLDYAKVVPLLVEAIKEQQEQIEDLQKKLEEMSK
jgi:hypothetical protein